jgi:subtilisin family serine protease
VFSRFSGDECRGHEENPCIAAYVSDQVAALERVYALRHVFPIASVNISIGGGTPVSSQATCDSLDGPRKEVIENLRSVGIPTVVGAGNEGVANGLSAPACLSAAVSVGATNDADTVPRFSNSAPFLTFLAPGVDITSSGPRGEVATLSGTSMAAPHVAAAFAVLRQAAPAATLTTLLDAIADGGVAITDRRNGVTTPRVDLPGALDELGVSLGGPPVGVFEIPPSGGRISGILAFTGWICDAELVEIQVDGGPRVPAAYGTGRGDTIAACGDADNGVSLLFNFALLGDGLHTASLLADGVEVGTSTFEVATLGAPFVHDLPDTIHRIEDFGGQDVLIQWSQQLQNFVIVGTE